MVKDVSVFLGHILESMAAIDSHVQGLSYEQFTHDIKTQDAVMRRFEIIGEAVKNIPDNIKTEHPEIQWKQIAGLRDILIHQYFGIDLQLVWRALTEKIPDTRLAITLVKQSLDQPK